MHPSLIKLLKNGMLWSGPQNAYAQKATSDYRNKPLGNTSTQKIYFQESINITTIKSKIQEIFFQSGLEEQNKNLWFPAYSFICKSLQSIITNNGDLKIAWISSNLTPNLDLIYSYNLQEATHLIFTPKKEETFSFTRNVIKENCFDIIISSLEKLSFAQSRSLQLVGKGSSSINIVLRPPWEINTHSASFLKLLVSPGLDSKWKTEITKIKARI